MFSWFRSARRAVPPPRRCLSLEALETRSCPAAPLIANLQVTYNGQNSVTLTGLVLDETPSFDHVQFTGAAFGWTNVGVNGQFSYTTSATLGLVGAVAFDPELLRSQAAIAAITTAAPVITNFACVNTSEDYYTISGHVLDESAAGLTVVLSNLPGVGTRLAVVDANGNFSLTLRLSEVQTTISAQSVDWWGVASATVYTDVVPTT
jgi:hypothetical protein